MTEKLEIILDRCLSQIVAGEATVAGCLGRYPDLADELEPLLLAAEEIRAAPIPELSPEARANIEAQLMAAVDAMPTRLPAERERPRFGLAWRWATVGLGAALAVFLVFVLLGNTVVNALPGSPLHPVKLAAEDTLLLLAPAHTKPRLQLTFARSRLEEIAASTARGSLDPALVGAMTKETEAALAAVESLPPAAAAALVEELAALIAEQQKTLSALQQTAPSTSQGEVAVALQSNAEQKGRTSALVSRLPVPPAIAVTESASPGSLPEPGGVVEFRVRVTNDGIEDVTLISLTKALQGDPNGETACSVPLQGITLRPGESYECAFSAFVFRNAGEGETDTVTAVAVDNEGNTARVSASASVQVVDVQPAIVISKTANPGSVPEPGGTVQHTVRVTNDSPETINLISLVDDLHGDLNGRGSCSLPDAGTALSPGASYTCTFSAQVAGNAGDTERDTATADAVDDEGNLATAADDAIVSISDLPPKITVNQTANPSSVPEPGQTVRFTVRVSNRTAEEIRLRSLEDDTAGDLDGRGTCSVPEEGRRLGPEESYSCSFAAVVAGNAGYSETRSVRAVVFDDEGNRVDDRDSVGVSVTDVRPAITVSQTAAPSSVPEPGGPTAFTVLISNQSVEEVTLNSMVDDVTGDLRGVGNCLAARGGIRLASGGSYRCTYSANVTGNAGQTRTNSVTVTAADDEGNLAKATGSTAITLADLVPRIEVSQTVNPATIPEPGASAQINVVVTNAGAEYATLASLVDELHGNLDGVGDCSVPASGRVLRPGGSYRCAFSLDVFGNPGYTETDRVTAIAVDDEGNRVKAASEAGTVRITDVPPAIAVVKTATPSSVPEPGAVVQYTVGITNTSVERVVLTSLVDDLRGDLNGQGDCSLPPGGLALDPRGAYRCSFAAKVVGNGGAREIGTVTAQASDDEQNKVAAADSVTVVVSDVPPMVTLTKTASPNSLPEPGGPVQFVVRTMNEGIEDVKLVSLVDDLRGDLNGQGTCSVPPAGLTLSPGASYDCAFTAEVRGNAEDIASSTVIAQVSDDEGNLAKPSASASVRITNVQPAIAVIGAATPGSVPEWGGLVRFVVQVANNSVEDVILTSITDSAFGDWNGRGSCLLSPGGARVSPGGTYECAFEGSVSGDAGDIGTNTITVRASDDEGNQVEASASTTVAFTDMPPVIAVMKSANPSSVPEPGGVVQLVVRVTNESGEMVWLTSLTDDVHGRLDGLGTCSVPSGGIALTPAESYGCAFSAEVRGNAGDPDIDTVSAVAVDDEGNEVVASDSATVTITDVPPAIEVVMTASPSNVPEPGGVVQFTVDVINEGDELVRIISLVDDVHGDLNRMGTCSVPLSGRALAPGQSYGCTFRVEVFGRAGDSQTDTVTAIATDDEGSQSEAVDHAAVTIIRAPQVSATATASP